MQQVTLWRALLGVENTVVEHVEFDEDGQAIIARVRPFARVDGRCGRCGRRCPRYDGGDGVRRWRSLDAGTMKVWLEAEAPRVSCPDDGVVVRQVPWARHGAGHTHLFDQQVAWLATQTSKKAIVELMRVAWRTVGAILARVWRDVEAEHDLLAGLRRIGIDEISYRRGMKFLTVVVDHDSGRLVWAAPGKDRATLRGFFDALEASGAGRCAQITHVTSDAAPWIAAVVAERCPGAVRCADAFHIVRWATEALDEVRIEQWRAARAAGHTFGNGHGNVTSSGLARVLKRSRYALWKNPGNLTERQSAKLAWIAKTSPRLHRAYLLKEGLRLVFQLGFEEAGEALSRWIGWARRSRIPAFVHLQRRIVAQRDAILAAIEHGLSNGRIESVNTKIRLVTRMAFGFRSPAPLIALAMLSLGGHKPVLPR